MSNQDNSDHEDFESASEGEETHNSTIDAQHLSKKSHKHPVFPVSGMIKNHDYPLSKLVGRVRDGAKKGNFKKKIKKIITYLSLIYA